ncbi:unnamed protein product, partial [Ectocarpus sp. 13 AM-2016]
VENFALTPEHANSIRQTLNRRRGISVVYLSVRSILQNCSHACLLLFDARTRKQHFFNPEGSMNFWLNIAFGNRPTTLVEGFETARVNEDAWPIYQQSMQAIVDNNHYRIDGNCALYCILVGVLCMRFGMGQPKLMGDLIVEALREIDTYNGLNVHQGNNYVGSHMTRLWNWMLLLMNHAKTMALPLRRGEVAEVDVSPDNNVQRCFAYGKLCSTTACVGQAPCWQHKFLTRNHRLTGAGRMRCVAPQHPC